MKALRNASAATPSAPFYECPAIGDDQSCGILIYITNSGTQILSDPSQGPYDGGDDTLVGVLNTSNSTASSLSLSSNSGIFGFDGDGICTYSWFGSGSCPFGPTGYEGPGTSFSVINSDEGSVNFTNQLMPGASAFFGLENALTQASLSPPNSYVALGDSYSSGEGTIDPSLSVGQQSYPYSGYPAGSSPKDGCDRGPAAWPVVMANESQGALALHGLGADDSFFACSGATTNQMENAPAGNTAKDTDVAEFSHLRTYVTSHGPPAVLTVTAGGDNNQVGFAPVLTLCYLLGTEKSVPLTPGCGNAIDLTINYLTKDRTQFEDTLKTFYNGIRTIVGPSTSINVVGYPRIMKTPSFFGGIDAAFDHCMQWISPGDLNTFFTAENDLNSDIESAAGAAGVNFISTQTSLAGHELCTGSSYIVDLDPLTASRNAAGHPTPSGQDNIASAVLAQLTQSATIALSQHPTHSLAMRKDSGQAIRENTASDDPLSIDASGVPEAVPGVPYLGFLSASGGQDPYTWSVTSGSLPNGLSLDPTTGIISGEVDIVTSSTFTVEVQDSTSPTPQSTTSQVTISSVAAASLAITSTSSLAPGTVGQQYSTYLQADGGTNPDTWSLTSGSLPAGLTLDDSSGQIFGSPTASGTINFTVGVSDSSVPSAQSASAAVSIQIAPSTSPLSITTQSLPNVEQGAYFDSTVISTGGVEPILWSIATGALPDGMVLDPGTGEIAGIPTSYGSFPITIEATDRSSPTAQVVTQGLTLTVSEAPAVNISSTTLADASQGVSYAADLDGTGGVAPYSWSITSGSLPDGLALDPSSGAISGVPTDSGSFSFSAALSDSSTPSAQSMTQDISLDVAPSAPTLSGSLSPGAVGTPYQDAISVSGGVAPYSWSITSGSLPNGLILDPNSGTISGTPTASGTFTFTIGLDDSSTPAAQTTSIDATLDIAAAPPLTILNSALQGAVDGTPYLTLITVSGGAPTYNWSLASGSLPTGLSLDPTTGVISGTPTSTGSFSFSITVTDSSTPTAQTATQALSIAVVTPPPLSLQTSGLPDGIQGVPYVQDLVTSGGQAPLTWQVVSGDLPDGLSIDASSGSISGTPTGNGLSTFTVEVSDSTTPTAQTASEALSINVDPSSPVEIDTSELPSATQGSSYAAPVAVDGGVTPYTWSLSTGSLPDGLTLDPSSGIISGEATGFGDYTFGVTVTDSSTPTPSTATASYDIDVIASGPLALSTTTIPAGTQGQYYSDTIGATGGAGPYSWSVTKGSLPGGVNLDQSGDLYGEITSASSETFTVTVSDQSSPTAQSVSQQYTLDVTPAPPLALSTTSIPAGTQGQYYDQNLGLTGGVAPYSWSVASGTLPDGLSLDQNGDLYGEITSASTETFTITVSDQSSPVPQSISEKYTLTVTPARRMVIAPRKLTLIQGQYSDRTLPLSGGTPGYRWVIHTNHLPSGLNFSGGQIYGSTTQLGTYKLSGTVSDSSTPRAQKLSFSVSVKVVVPQKLKIATRKLPDARVGSYYQQLLTVTGGSPGFTWSVKSGSLPPGMTLDSSGYCYGTPTRKGTYSFTVDVVDSGSPTPQSALKKLKLVVSK